MKNNEEFKEDIGIYNNESELDSELEKISKKLSLTLNVLPGKSNRCCLVSCPCGNALDHLSCASFLNDHKDLVHYITSREYNSVSLSMLYKTVSLLNIPLRLKLSEFFFQNLIYLRKTINLTDLGGFFSERSLTYGTRDVPSHSRQLKLDALIENAKAKEILKRSLFNQQVILDHVVNHRRSRSVCSIWRKSFDLDNSPSCVEVSFLKKSKSEMKPVCKRRPEVKFPEMEFISCPSINPAFSGQSTSTAGTIITRGQLHCFQKCERPYLVFSVDDAPQLLYVARPQKIESSSEKAIDCIYLFYLNDSKTSDYIAKMKVTSSIVLNQNMVKTMETEFVLCASQEELSNRIPKSSCEVSRSKSFPKKITKMFRPINMTKNKPRDKIGGEKLNELGDSVKSNIVNDALDEFLPNIELASIVVEECLQNSTEELKLGGWGLKFLDKASQFYTSSEILLPQHCNQNISFKKDEPARSMNVIIPASFHGGPLNQIGGPASLIDRWRSGGHCDCGGWDIGCPVRVLTYDSIHSDASQTVKDAGNLMKSFDLFMEGTKNGGKPTLSIVNLTGGVYSVYFRSSLSALQSFSVAIAVIHTKFPDLFISL